MTRIDRPGGSQALSLPRFVVGAFLALFGVVPIAQSVRAMRQVDRATTAYETNRLLESPVEFGGRVIVVHDTLPQLRSSDSPEREAMVGVLLDGDTILAPQPVIVSLSAPGLARYWLWIHVQIVRDRATNQRALYISRRVAGSPAENPSFEVLRISEDGATAISSPSAAERRDNPLLYVVLTPLASELPLLPYTSYGAFIATDSLLLGMLFSVLPFVSIGLGLWLLQSTVRGLILAGRRAP